jgi:cytochrome P450
VVRIQPNHLSFSSPAAHNEIYGFKNKFIKGEFYTEILSEYGRSSIVSAMYLPIESLIETTRSDVDHGRLRRILGSGFTNTALGTVEPNIKSHVSKLCERLAIESRKGPVDLAKWFACFSFDVLPKTTFLTMTGRRGFVAR